MNEMPDSLLAADEPAPVTVHSENGSSPFLIVADHAGNSMPRALDRIVLSKRNSDARVLNRANATHLPKGSWIQRRLAASGVMRSRESINRS